jgi:hypothetical protein
MDACPVCRASLNGASICRRCRADLRQVKEIAQRGQALVGAAMLSLAEGDVTAAARWLDRARAVHASPAVRILRGLMESPRRADDASRFQCVRTMSYQSGERLTYGTGDPGRDDQA